MFLHTNWLFSVFSVIDSLKLGRPCVLTVEEEQLIAKTFDVVSNWGFPMTHQLIRLVVAKFVKFEERQEYSGMEEQRTRFGFHKQIC